jgi:hypothetical protein
VVPLSALLALSLWAPSGLSLAAYQKLLGAAYYLGVIWNSLKLA